MKISYNWLKSLIDTGLSPEETARILTASGLEVEHVEKTESLPGGLKGVVAGKVLSVVQHPNADRLRVTTVDVGSGTPLPIVCGAANVAAGQTVWVATEGTVIYPKGGEPFTIKKSKLRGEDSHGMICAEDELGLGTSHDGIMVLPDAIKAGTKAADYYEISEDYVLEIGLTPNRADAASHLGVARDLRALTGKEVFWPEVGAFKEGDAPTYPITIDNTEECPRYTAVVIEGIKVAPSPSWLQNRLKAIGVNPINNVVDITNFVLHELGQPLHAFDKAQIKTGKIRVGHCAQGANFTTLDGTVRKLHAADLMITDGTEGLCMAGVFGGLHSGVSESTTAIVLESAYFNPSAVRATSLRHGLKTDSSFRFERGTDPNMPLIALKRAALLIAEIAGGKVTSKVFDSHPEGFAPFVVTLKKAYLKTITGIDIPNEDVLRILTSLSIQVVKETAEAWMLEVPRVKVDVQRPADVAEEVLRIYGYDKVPLSPYLGSPYLAPKADPMRYGAKKKTSGLLSGFGFNEIFVNSLTRPAYVNALPLGEGETAVEIQNKLSEDLGMMRTHLLLPGLDVVAYNINRKQKNLKLYEWGKTYSLKNGQYAEQEWLALWLCGHEQEESWAEKSKEADFSTIKTAVEALLARPGRHLTTQPTTAPWAVGGLDWLENGKIVMRAGMVKPQLTKLADVKAVVWYAEAPTEILKSEGAQKQIYQEISRYPEVRRDLSIVMDKKVTFSEIAELARKTDKTLIREINVFDVYEGDKLEAGKKSYSVSYILNADDHTLTDEEIDAVMEKLIAAYEKQLGGLIRR